MSLPETLERIRSSPSSNNEESAKFQVIAPILNALGWDPSDGEKVLFEHSVGGKKGGRVDIALKNKSRVFALIEAKAPGADLSTHVELVELISKRVYDKVSIRPSNEQVVAVLHNSPVPMAAPPIPEQSGKEPEKGKAAERSASTPTVKPVAIVLWGDRYPVETHVDVLRTVAEKLFERHSGEFDKILELRGRKHPFVARDPHALLKPERSYEVAASGFFLT